MSQSIRLGLLGRKVGMMRLFTDDGDSIPVTVLDVSNNRVTQVKTAGTDGYDALQIAFGSRKASRAISSVGESNKLKLSILARQGWPPSKLAPVDSISSAWASPSFSSWRPR